MTTTDAENATSPEVASFVEAWTAVWRDHDGQRWPTLLHEDGVLRNPFGELSRAELPGYMDGLVATISDHRIAPLSWRPTPDGVLIEWLMTGSVGAVPLEIRGVDRFTLRDGLVVEGVAYFDPAPLVAPSRSGAPIDLPRMAVEYDRAWRAMDPDAIAAWHAEDGSYQLHVAGLPAVAGRDGIRATVAASLAVWRDLTFSFDKAYYGDSFFVWQSTMHGVLAQSLGFGSVSIPANGKPLSLRGVDVITVNGDGLIQSKETHFDFVAALNQANAI